MRNEFSRGCQGSVDEPDGINTVMERRAGLEALQASYLLGQIRISRRIDKIAQRLPPDGGVRIEHPVQNGHGPESSNGRGSLLRPETILK
jgi:hypothetical protein